MRPKDADIIANSVDPGLHCLLRLICLKTSDHYGNPHRLWNSVSFGMIKSDSDNIRPIRTKPETDLSHYEIMALFVLRKLILQTCMRSHPVGLDVWFLVWFFVYFHTSCVRTAKALARQRGCAGSPEPTLVAYLISTLVSWAGSILISKLNR